MTIAGIICEYNPFHSGHSAHIEATRRILGEDTHIVCAMSGNFAQRGEPAIMEKHARAEAAVLCGADLVLEIPTVWAVSSAERFATGGTAVLAALGLPLTLSFGSECGDIDALRAVAGSLADDKLMLLTREMAKSGVSYAAARSAAISAALGDGADIMRSPNNLLAIEYLRAIERLGAEHISAVTVQRVMTEHDGGAVGGLAPASLLREKLLAGEDISRYLPPASAEILRREAQSGRAPVSMSALEDALLYKLRTMPREDYARLPDATEGLDVRFMRAGLAARSYDELLRLAKTKRYVMSRLRRMALAALLGITGDMQKKRPEYIRVLALNSRGSEILHAAKKTASLPIITRPASAKRLDPDARALFELEARCTDIYSLAYPSREARVSGAEWKTGVFTV